MDSDSPDTREEHSERVEGFYSLWQLVGIERRVRKETVETDNQKKVLFVESRVKK